MTNFYFSNKITKRTEQNNRTLSFSNHIFLEIDIFGSGSQFVEFFFPFSVPIQTFHRPVIIGDEIEEFPKGEVGIFGKKAIDFSHFHENLLRFGFQIWDSFLHEVEVLEGCQFIRIEINGIEPFCESVFEGQFLDQSPNFRNAGFQEQITHIMIHFRDQQTQTTQLLTQ